jgi:ssDNA-binding replication factor A large subunit
MNPVSTDKLEELITGLREHRNWITELHNLNLLINKLDTLNKVTSTRELAGLIRRSKSWVGVSILLIKGMKVYPEIEKFASRNMAYTYLQKKNRMRRFLQS